MRKGWDARGEATRPVRVFLHGQLTAMPLVEIFEHLNGLVNLQVVEKLRRALGRRKFAKLWRFHRDDFFHLRLIFFECSQFANRPPPYHHL